MSGWRLSAPASWADILVACSRATGQGLRRCAGRTSVTWRGGECGTTEPIVRCILSLEACRSRPDRLLEIVLGVCGRSLRRRSARQPCEPSGDFLQPPSRPLEGCCRAVLRVGALSPSLSVAVVRSSQPPHRAPRINPVLSGGAQSAVPVRPQWKTLRRPCWWRCH